MTIHQKQNKYTKFVRDRTVLGMREEIIWMKEKQHWETHIHLDIPIITGYFGMILASWIFWRDSLTKESHDKNTPEVFVAMSASSNFF